MYKVALEHTVATWEVLLHMHDCMTPTFSFSFWSRVVPGLEKFDIFSGYPPPVP